MNVVCTMLSISVFILQLCMHADWVANLSNFVFKLHGDENTLHELGGCKI